MQSCLVPANQEKSKSQHQMMELIMQALLVNSITQERLPVSSRKKDGTS